MKISADLRAVLNQPELKKRIEDIASYTRPMTPGELLAYIREEKELWRPIITQVGMKGK
jgi:tripartite-type tricarboxylate transporter receptor subunit TctC